VFAQAPAGLPAPPAPLADGHVLATVNGSKLTVARLREMLTGAPELALRSAGVDQREFLLSHALLQHLRSEALKSGIAKKSPYAERLAWSRMQILQGAMFAEKTREFQIRETDALEYYKNNQHLFANAQVRLLFLAGNTPAVQAKAAALLKQARAGADFVKLVALHSQDPESAADGGLLSPVIPESRYPAEVKKSILAAAPGAVTLVAHDGEQYLFKIESLKVKPFEEARDAATGDLVKGKMDAWIAEVRKTIEVKIEHEKFFKTLPQTAGPFPQNYTGPAANEEIKEDTLLATINGTPLTAEQFTNLMKGVGPQVRANAVLTPNVFLDQYALLLRLTEMAEKAGYPERQPYKNQIGYNEEQILSQAAMDSQLNNIAILPDEQRKAYDDNVNRFRFARVRVLYVSYSMTPPPQTGAGAKKVLSLEEARARINEILTQLRAGKLFTEMVAQYSEDADSRGRGGEIPPILADDQRIPEQVRNIVLSAKAGEIPNPVQLANGIYLFKIEEQGSRTYEEVKDMVYEELRQARFQKWFDGVRNSFDVKIEDATAFRQVVEEAVKLARG
jgi:parvulin-like peptidyl-prolyl isomerase